MGPAGRAPRAEDAALPDSHEPNDWADAARAQRTLHPGAVVVASLGYAGDVLDVYRVDVPAGAGVQATLRKGARGLTLRVLRVTATDAQLGVQLRSRAQTGQIAVPAGRWLLVVARAHGAGPYTLALSGP